MFPRNFSRFLVLCSFFPLFTFAEEQRPTLPAPPLANDPAIVALAPGEPFEEIWSDGEVSPDAPVVAEWNRTASPGESLTLTGTRFTLAGDQKDDTTVWVYAGGDVVQADVWILEENLMTISLPDSLEPGFCLIWVQNRAGVGLPVAINRTMAQWIGPLGNRAAPGDRKRVFGRNFPANVSQAFAGLSPAAGGDLLTLKIQSGNPYALEFEVPADLPPGSYRLWIHNGSGGQLGWSEPLAFDVIRRSPSTERVDISPANAASLQTEIDRLGSKQGGGSVHLDPGVYRLEDTLVIRPGVRLIGVGAGSTVLQGAPVFLDAPPDSQIEIRDLTIQDGLRCDSTSVNNIRKDQVHDVRIENVELLGQPKLKLNGLRIAVLNSRIPVIDGIGVDCWFSGNTVIGQNPATSHRWAYQAAVYAGNGLRSVVEKNRFRNEWPMDENGAPVRMLDDRKDSIKSWYVRLFLAGSGKGGFDQSYLAENHGENIAGQINRDGNVGEMILLHCIDGSWLGSVTSSTGTDVQLSSDPILDADGVPIRFRKKDSGGPVRVGPNYHLVILHGQGLGQARRIVEHTESRVTVDRPWRVPPGPGSHVAIVPLYTDNIIYKNELSAFPKGFPMDYSKSQGVSLFGNCWNTIVDGTITRRSFNAEVIHARSLSPSYWNEIRNGRGEDIYFSGAHITTGIDPQPKLPGAVTLGNMIRHGKYHITGPWVTGRGGPMLRSEIGQHNPKTPRSELPAHLGNVIEYMEAEGGKIGLGSSRHSKGVFRRNLLKLADDPNLSDIPVRRGISWDVGSEDRFSQNRFENMDELAAAFDFMHYAIQDTGYRRIVETPADPAELVGRITLLNHVARIVGDESSVAVPVANTGLASLDLTIRSGADWITTDVKNVTIDAGQIASLEVTVNRAKMPRTQTNPAVITLSGNNQEVVLSVAVD